MILTEDGDFCSFSGFENYGKVQKGSRFKSLSQQYLGRKPGEHQRFGDVLHENYHLVFRNYKPLNPQSSKVLKKVFSEISWWFDNAPGKSIQQYAVINAKPTPISQQQKDLSPLERIHIVPYIHPSYLPDKYSFPKDPPIPFDQTDFKTLEDFYGNNTEKDSTRDILMLLRQAIHLAKYHGYLEFDFKHSFDLGEEPEPMPYTNTRTNNPGLKVKVNFYITAWKDKNKKDEIKLVLERNLYLQCTTDKYEALKGAATHCNIQLKHISHTTILTV